MKKKNKTTVKKDIIKATAVTVLLSSCSVDYSEYNIGEGAYDALLTESSSEKGSQLLNITEFKLTGEVEKYARTMKSLIEDITKSEDESTLFCSDPDAYISKDKYKNLWGINISEYLTEKDKMILKAIADNEVRGATKKGDLSEFIRLCRIKGLLSDATKIVSRGYVNYKRFFKSEEEFRLFVEQMSKFEQMSKSKFTTASDKQEFVLGIVAVVGARIGAYVDDYVYEHAHWLGYPKEMAMGNVLYEEPVLRLWAKENTDTYISSEFLFDELVIQKAEELSSAIVGLYPNYDKEKIQEFIALNLQKFYELKK
jgi:hypothetical protein